MLTLTRLTTAALALAASLFASETAQAGPRYGGHASAVQWHRGAPGWHGHPGHGGSGGYWRGGLIGLGLGIGIGSVAYGSPYWRSPWYYGYPSYPGYVVSDAPPVVYYEQTPQPVPRAPAATAPDPVVYPRNGQTAAQTEADRRECNRWATSQPNAMADATVFQRATLACLEGRGYTVR